MISKSTRCPGFILNQGDITTTKLPLKFDSVIALFHVMSYQTTNDSIRAAFSNAGYHLTSRGLFLFDFWYAPAVLTIKAEKRTKLVEDDLKTIIRHAQPVCFPNENKVRIDYTFIVIDRQKLSVNTFKESHELRYFSLPEIDFLADSAGFKRLSAEEWLTGASPSEETWGVSVVLRKK